MITIRRCTLADFQNVLPLLQQLWPGRELNVGALQKVFSQGVAAATQEYICAEADSKIIGFCSLLVKNNLWQEGNLGHVDELVVDSAHRRRGVGSQLLDRIIEVARENGCRRVELDTAFHRATAHQFYEQRGFENRAYLFSKVL